MNSETFQRAGLIAGGALLMIYGLRRRSPAALAAALIGAAAAVRGATMRGSADDLPARASIPHQRGITIEKSVTISRPVEELYRFWRNFENLPQIMKNIEAVRVLDTRRSRWLGRTVGGKRVEWDAEIVHEEENALISWRTLENADVQHAGSVHFGAKPHGRGTAVRVIMRYDPPAGRLGAVIARLAGDDPEKQLADDLRRFKGLMEVGEIPSTEGQPAGATAPLKSKFIDVIRNQTEAIT